MSSVLHRAVFDCVVFAQALINPRGPAGECLERARTGVVRLFVSDYVLAEIRELPRKIPPRYGVTAESADELASDLVKFATVVSSAPSVYVHPHDPDDSHYVDLAVATNSSLIVSRDRHLLKLMDVTRPEARDFRRRFPGIDVLSPDAFAQQLRDEEASPPAP